MARHKSASGLHFSNRLMAGSETIAVITPARFSTVCLRRWWPSMTRATRNEPGPASAPNRFHSLKPIEIRPIGGFNSVLEGEVVAPSSFSQRRLWILDRLYGQRASYIVSCPYRVSGPLDIARLQQSLDAIVHRHEALRTSFRLEGDDVVQVIRPDLSVPITVQDLGHIPQTGRFDAAVEHVALEAARPFDLETAPLIRVRLYRLGEQDHLLALCFHHAIFDGWSEDVFLTELAALYDAAACDGTGETLRELPIQYRDFAVWQRETSTDPAVQTSLEVWRERLTGAPAVLNLPLDYPPARRAHAQGWAGVPVSHAGTKRHAEGCGPAARRHTVHDVAGRLQRGAPSLLRRSRSRDRHGVGRPDPRGDRAVDRVLHQHGRLARRSRPCADVCGAARPDQALIPGSAIRTRTFPSKEWSSRFTPSDRPGRCRFSRRFSSCRAASTGV